LYAKIHVSLAEIGLCGGNIGLFYRRNIGLFKGSFGDVCLCVCLFISRILALFCGDTGCFGGNVGLVGKDVGLLVGEIGLFS